MMTDLKFLGWSIPLSNSLGTITLGCEPLLVPAEAVEFGSVYVQ